MSPDRGGDADAPQREAGGPQAARLLPEGQHFTFRGVAVGLLVGLVICFSNMYFGLQTGWVSTMTMPASLLGFGIFRALAPHLKFPFSPVENVLVQSVAGGMAIMPLGCGFVGVVSGGLQHGVTCPDSLTFEDACDAVSVVHGRTGAHRIEFMEDDSMVSGSVLLWSRLCCASVSLVHSRFPDILLKICSRRQVIIREQLKFPSGFSTAVLIGVLHGKNKPESGMVLDPSKAATFGSLALENRPLLESEAANDDETRTLVDEESLAEPYSWGANIKLLLITFSISGVYTLSTYFFPILRNLPVFGTYAAKTWLWDLNPSLAYVGQGIIMGPATTLHMLLGAVIGWGMLSPLAKYMGWAPGPVGDWESGSKGWIVWVSLAIMLADSVVSLGYVAFRPLVQNGPAYMLSLKQGLSDRSFRGLFGSQTAGYTVVGGDEDDPRDSSGARTSTSELLPSPSFQPEDGQPLRVWDHDDAPPEQLVGSKTVGIGLVLSILVCVASIHITFGDLVPLYANVIAILMALVLSIMGVRALGETDLNPVSGISKLAQLFFALIIPQSNKASVLINLVAGAVSEAGALQAGDLMQDLKTGHLLGAAPNAQFWGQVIGATVGAVVSAFIYRLYTAVYQVPGDLFQVPTAYVWIFTARLVTGQGLPPLAREWAFGAAVLFAVLTALRTKALGKSWQAYIPGGIAVAIGPCYPTRPSLDIVG